MTTFIRCPRCGRGWSKSAGCPDNCNAGSGAIPMRTFSPDELACIREAVVKAFGGSRSQLAGRVMSKLDGKLQAPRPAVPYRPRPGLHVAAFIAAGFALGLTIGAYL